MFTRVAFMVAFDFLCCKYCASFEEIPLYRVKTLDFLRNF